MHFDDGTFPFAARAEVPQETRRVQRKCGAK